MNNKIIATISLGAIAFFCGQSTLAQVEPVSKELFLLCARFPNNSKCQRIEIPTILKERNGEEVGCSFRFNPGELPQEGGCKLVTGEAGITVYREHGDEIELLDEKRGTSESELIGDRVFSINHQVWNKIHRWEIGFLPEENSPTNSDTNFVVIFLSEKQSESIGNELESLFSSKPRLVTKLVAKSKSSSANIAQLLETKECQYCDLSNADLSGADLKGANLVGANLQGANLAEAKLNLAYLLGANLHSADLTGANLQRVNLTFANLTRSILANSDSRGSNFQQANLKEADLTEANFSAPTFLEKANLSQAILKDSDLKGANFHQANLTGADLTGADLGKTDIKLDGISNNYDLGERLVDTLIGFPIFSLSSGGVDFFTDFTGADLQEANLSSTDLDRVNFENSNLTNVDFKGSNIEPEDLEELKLCGVTLADGKKSDRDCS